MTPSSNVITGVVVSTRLAAGPGGGGGGAGKVTMQDIHVYTR